MLGPHLRTTTTTYAKVRPHSQQVGLGNGYVVRHYKPCQEARFMGGLEPTASNPVKGCVVFLHAVLN